GLTDAESVRTSPDVSQVVGVIAREEELMRRRETCDRPGARLEHDGSMAHFRRAWPFVGRRARLHKAFGILPGVSMSRIGVLRAEAHVVIERPIGLGRASDGLQM